MFVNNDFFDADDDDNLNMNASKNTGANGNSTQKKEENYNLGNSVRKEFGADGTAFYDNSKNNENNREYNFSRKTSVTFTKRQLTTATLSKSKADNTVANNFLYGRDNNSESQKLVSSNFEYEQKKSTNDDLDFTNLDTNDNYSNKQTSLQYNNFGSQSSVLDGRRMSKDGGGLARPGTSSGTDLRQKLLLQQKQRLLDQQRVQFTTGGAIQANDIPNNRNQSTALYYKPEENKEINYDELAKQAYDAKKEFYDPSMKKNDKTGFVLSKGQQNIKYQNDEEYIPPTRKDMDAANKNPTNLNKNQPDEVSEDDDENLDAKKMEELEKNYQIEKANHQNAPKEAKIEIVTQSTTQSLQQQLPEPDTDYKLLTVDSLDSVDMRSFLMKPAPKGYLVQCSIKRDKSGFARFFPQYYVHLSNGYRFLLAGKKRAGNRTSNYAISMSAKDFKKNSPACLGKLRSNFIGTEFNIYDHGLNPKKAKMIERFREHLGVVLYEASFMGSKGPRKMRVLLPEVNSDGDFYKFKPMSKKEGILASYMNGRHEGIRMYVNKIPKWNEQYQAFLLNFNGRVEKPSVKNFQLVNEVNQEDVLLQFGRVNNDTFNMDFTWPLSPFQAFTICLTSFDFKIACE